MAQHWFRLFNCLKRQAVLFFLMTGLLLIFVVPSFGGPSSHKSKRKNFKSKNEQKSNYRVAGNSQSQSNSNKKKYSNTNRKKHKRNAEKFKSMPPSKQKELREKMNRFEKLSPREQNAYKSDTGRCRNTRLKNARIFGKNWKRWTVCHPKKERKSAGNLMKNNILLPTSLPVTPVIGISSVATTSLGQARRRVR
jgi:hypothetical protein